MTRAWAARRIAQLHVALKPGGHLRAGVIDLAEIQQRDRHRQLARVRLILRGDLMAPQGQLRATAQP